MDTPNFHAAKQAHSPDGIMEQREKQRGKENVKHESPSDSKGLEGR